MAIPNQAWSQDQGARNDYEADTLRGDDIVCAASNTKMQMLTEMMSTNFKSLITNQQYPQPLDPTEILTLCEEISVWKALPEVVTKNIGPLSCKGYCKSL